MPNTNHNSTQNSFMNKNLQSKPKQTEKKIPKN